MTRVLDSNLVFSGHEPKFTKQLTKLELIQSLNWYSQNKDNKTAYKYAIDYLKKKCKIDVTEVDNSFPITFGWVCRIISNGGILLSNDQKVFDDMLQKIIEANKITKNTIPTEKKNIVSIQDRLNDKINEIAGILEGSIDDYISSKYKIVPSPYTIMSDKSAKGLHTKRIIEIFKQIRDEYDEVLNTDDLSLKEGYSNFSNAEIKKIIGYCDLIITDALKISDNSVKTRKPRKRKQKTPEQLVSKLKYSKKFDDLKLTSIDPTDIIGKMQLWIYNTKTRKLGCYQADDASGLTVKGSTILNFTESKSIQKKLRKPEQMLPEVINGGKVFLRNVLDDIRAVESKLTGRLNKDTILLRVVK